MFWDINGGGQGQAAEGNGGDVLSGFVFLSSGLRLLKGRDPISPDFIWPVPDPAEPGISSEIHESLYLPW